MLPVRFRSKTEVNKHVGDPNACVLDAVIVRGIPRIIDQVREAGNEVDGVRKLLFERVGKLAQILQAGFDLGPGELGEARRLCTNAHLWACDRYAAVAATSAIGQKQSVTVDLLEPCRRRPGRMVR